MAAALALPSAAPPVVVVVVVTPEPESVRAWIEARELDSAPDFARDLVRRLALRFARPASAHLASLPEPRPLEQWSPVANYYRPPSRPGPQRDRTSEQPGTRPGVLRP